MCGIIGAINMDKDLGDVNEDIIDQFQEQHSRGLEGFGAVIINKDKTITVKRATTESKLLLDLMSDKNQSPMVFMHHRNPTSTDNKLGQTHPIVTDDGSMKYKYLTIHNGVVRNDDELKERHEKLGFQYQTEITGYNNRKDFNDSEAVAIEVARLIENQVDNLKVEGSVAFITLQIDKVKNTVEQVFFGRNNMNPLNLSKSNKKIRLSSEGEGDPIKPNTMYRFNLDDFKLNKSALAFTEEEIDTTAKSFNWNPNKEEDKTPVIQMIDTEKVDEHGFIVNPVEELDAELENIKEVITGDIEGVLADLDNDLSDHENVLAMDVGNYLKRIGALLYEAKDGAENAHIKAIQEQYVQQGDSYAKDKAEYEMSRDDLPIPAKA